MNEAEFIKDRVDDQHDWYSRKSSRNKRYYLWFNGLIICSGATIPLVAAFSELHNGQYGMAVAGLGVLTAILSGLSALFKFQEKWATYRITAEALLREKFLYRTRSHPYTHQTDSFRLFVVNIERILDSENKGWAQVITSAGTPEQAAGDAAAADHQAS